MFKKLRDATAFALMGFVIATASACAQTTTHAETRPLELSAKPGSDAHKIISRVLANDIGFVKKVAGRNPELPFTEVDLDKDGTPEFIVKIDDPSMCGTAGCPIKILATVDGNTHTLFEVVAHNIGISKNYTNGMPDLHLNINDDGKPATIRQFSFKDGYDAPR